jgi:hypothetical protein
LSQPQTKIATIKRTKKNFHKLNHLQITARDFRDYRSVSK